MKEQAEVMTAKRAVALVQTFQQEAEEIRAA